MSSGKINLLWIWIFYILSKNKLGYLKHFSRTDMKCSLIYNENSRYIHILEADNIQSTSWRSNIDPALFLYFVWKICFEFIKKKEIHGVYLCVNWYWSPDHLRSNNDVKSLHADHADVRYVVKYTLFWNMQTLEVTYSWVRVLFYFHENACLCFASHFYQIM